MRSAVPPLRCNTTHPDSALISRRTTGRWLVAMDAHAQLNGASERLRQTQQVLGHVREDQVGRNRCHLAWSRLAELAFDEPIAGGVDAEREDRDFSKMKRWRDEPPVQI
jgi:hypothetical protein